MSLTNQSHRRINQKHNELAYYLLFVFLIPLFCILMMKICPFLQSGTGKLILFGIEGASPTISVLLLWFMKGNQKEIYNGLHKKYITNFSLKYSILSFVIPFVILTFAKMIVLILHPDQNFIDSLTLKKLTIVSWALIAEELGWRGFLQENLDATLSDKLVPFITGLIWALWHYHFILSGSMHIPILAFILGCIFESYGYYTITRVSNGNIIPASIWHFTGNLFFNLYRFDPSHHNGDPLAYWITTILYASNLIIFVIFGRKRKNSVDH